MDCQMEAKNLWENAQRHYNCCQAVAIPFARRAGLDEEAVYAMGAHFGAGMKLGATCGAISGGLMALGLSGVSDDVVRTFLSRFRDACGATDCPTLLKAGVEAGQARRVHCAEMVSTAAALVEELTASAAE